MTRYKGREIVDAGVAVDATSAVPPDAPVSLRSWIAGMPAR
jgi:hypothetical protein